MRKADKKGWIFKIIIGAVLLFAALLAMAPFIYMMLVSLTQKTVLDLNFENVDFSFINYNRVFRNFNLATNLTNSIIVTVCACVLNCVISSMAAYAFAKKKFPFRDQLFSIYLATLMIPGQVTLIPVFTIMKKLGLMNTYPALFLPIINAFGVFLIRQFMVTIPDELLEAARIDGCGENRIFISIVIPLIKSVMVSLMIFTFITCCNSDETGEADVDTCDFCAEGKLFNELWPGDGRLNIDLFATISTVYLPSETVCGRNCDEWNQRIREKEDFYLWYVMSFF